MLFTAAPLDLTLTFAATLSVVIAGIALLSPALSGPRGWRGLVFRTLHAACWLLFGLAALARCDTVLPIEQMPAFFGVGLVVFLLMMLMIHRAAMVARG